MEKLFHYCSSDTFANIIQSRKVRLSAMSLSNDSMEGLLVKRTVLELAARDKLSSNTVQKIEENLRFFDEMADGLALCLSLNGDLLSQWRAYADDGRGVAIGFSKSYLSALSDLSRAKKAQPRTIFTLREVKYDKTSHVAAVEQTYTELRRLIDDEPRHLAWQNNLLIGAKPKKRSAQEESEMRAWHATVALHLLSLFPDMYSLKSEAFAEECEQRLLSLHLYDLIPKESPIKFRGAGNKIIPFIEIELADIEGTNQILEVKLGPKHTTPPHVVEAMLRTASFSKFEVTRSIATYR